jgi:hypothetical protein
MQAIGKKAVDTSKKVRAGLIGASWTAEAHVTVPEIPDAEIAAMADPIPCKPEKCCQRNGINPASVHMYPDHASMAGHEHWGWQFSIRAAGASWPHVYKDENIRPECERRNACFRPRPVL